MTNATPSSQQRTVKDVVPYASLTLLDEDTIGCGAFGDVYKALHNEWGCPVAYKKLALHFLGERNKADQQLIQSLKYEAEIHRQLRHPNIVSMLGVVFEPGNYGIILEYVTYSSWSNFLKCVNEGSSISCVPWILKTKIAQEVSAGMFYLHNVPIIHCDLKVQNVLLGEQFIAKISDFGLSRWKNFSRSHSNAGLIKGTPSHIPPEMWKDIFYSPNDKSDVYSFSILLWEMFTEKEAFADRGTLIRDWVISGQRLPLDSIPRDVPKDVHNLITACWDQVAANRPSFSDITAKFRPYVHGPLRDEQIKNAKAIVLNAYFKRSVPAILSSQTDSDHGQKIQRVQETLCEFVRRPDQLLSILLQKRAITLKEQDAIRSMTSIYQWVEHLLNLLSVKPAAAYGSFLEALKATRQYHLHSLLEDKDYQMNVDHKVTLIDNITYLKENITLSDPALLDTLLQADVLDQREAAEIRSKGTDHDKTDQLLQFVFRTSQEQYQNFLESLRKANHQHVYLKLIATKPNDHPQNSEVNASAFLDKPTLLRVIPPNGSICGIAVMDSELFVVRGSARQAVDVYSCSDFSLIRNLKISGSKSLRAIVASQEKQLYISDDEKKVIYKYDLQTGYVANEWSVGGRCEGLSVTRTNSVLVTLWDVNRVEEYTSVGNLMREIKLNGSTDCPQHCVQLSGDRFVINHGDFNAYRVCIVDVNGQIIHSYGGSPGSGMGQMKEPRHMSVDGEDHVMVADWGNNRIVLLGPTLKHLGYVHIPGYQLKEPQALHFDGSNHRLYVGEKGGRMFVLSASTTIH